MDSRRAPRAVIDPKVRHVGFFAPGAPPERSHSTPPDPASPKSSSPLVSGISPSGNSISPVMIPPPRHLSDNLLLHNRPAASPLRGDSIIAGSYNSSSDFSPAPMSPTPSSYSNKVVGEGDLFDGIASPACGTRGNAGKVASSFPRGGFDLTAMRANSVPASELTTVSVVNDPLVIVEKDKADKGGGLTIDAKEQPSSSKPQKEKLTKAERRALQEAQRTAKVVAKEKDKADKGGGLTIDAKEEPSSSKLQKEKLTKAERRALQEAQRAAKVVAKAEGNKASGTANAKPAKAAKPSQKADNASVAATEKKGCDRPSEKDRKKDVPQPRMQYDDKSRVEKAKRRAVVKQTEARNRVELFRHLPQYEHGSQLPDLVAKFFQLDPMHPAVYKVGLLYLSGDISGGNARCVAMLQAFQEVIKDYRVPPKKALARDLTAKISSYVSFLIECRPLSISMGNAIRFLKSRIAKLPLTLSEAEAKASLQTDIDRFISEKIILANKVITKHAVTKIRDGDVLLTYGSSSAVEMILLHAHELGKQFRVVVVDSRPKLSGQLLLNRLVAKGLSCTYTHINAVSYIMHEVTRVFLGASSVLSNGTVYSRVGTACVAMVAHAFRVPVLVCCEAYKFHERVQLDSICSNELGDPDVISKVQGRDVNNLDGWANTDNLQLLNLVYDATPSDYVSMIVTDYGMVPPTSVPVIVREYRREQLWI